MESRSSSSLRSGHPAVELHFLRGVLRAASARIEAFPVDASELWLARAVEVLSANIATGRFRLAEPLTPDTPTLLAYAQQMLTGLLAEWDLIERLRAGDVAAWEAARYRLERLAYNWLGPYGREDWAAWEARESAAKTCSDLWWWLDRHTFPFDVSFECWSAKACINRLQEATRKRKTRGQYEVDSLDRPVFDRDETLGETIPEYDFDEWLEAAGNREVLLQALAQLDEHASAVIRKWYLEGWSGDEIATALGLTLNNVYVHRFRAIEKLRKLLKQDERFGLAEALQRVEANKRRLSPDVVPQGSEAPHGS